ncbi:MAG: right-handed parallel beta-helix repeat-containing protein [Ruminococcus sp.]|nr:right-handed parallel beta-helix repeat-containing protein [Ruminococcus sp.]
MDIRGYEGAVKAFFRAFGSVLMFFLAAVFCSPASAAGGKTIYVRLYEGENNGGLNYQAIHQALMSADEKETLTVVLPRGGEYYINTTTGNALRMKSNTVLDLNGSTIKKSGNMFNTNMLQNCDSTGEKLYGTGYYMTHDITVKNGTIDGCGYSPSAVEVNLVNFGHATGVKVLNVDLRNSYQGHLIEFSGCQDCLVKDCTFSGFYGVARSSSEALQIDISHPGWNGAYYCDDTVSKNITVTGCTFYDYPIGIGNHHTLSGGHHMSGIVISSNNFLNTRRYAENGPAIHAYAFDNSTVTGNNICGLYSQGIREAAGYPDITRNTINLRNTPGSIGIYGTLTNSYRYGGGSSVTEYITSGSVSNNLITQYGQFGIFYTNQAVLRTVSGNTVTRGTGTGILIANSRVTSGMDRNHVSNCRYYSNDSPGNGIHIQPSSFVSSMSGNSARSCAGLGIGNYTHSTDVLMTGNFYTNNAGGTYKTWSGAGWSTVRPDNVKSLKSAAVSSSSVILTWGQADKAEGYVIYRSTDGGMSYERLKKQSFNVFTDTSVKPNTSYFYAVKGYKTVDGAELLSSSSATVTVYTRYEGPEITVTSPGKGIVSVQWKNVTGASGYEISSKRTSGEARSPIGCTTGTSFLKNGFVSGENYYISVRAYKTIDGKNYYSTVSEQLVKVS